MYLIVLSLTQLLCKSNTAHRMLRMVLASLGGAAASLGLLLAAPGLRWASLGIAVLVVPAMLLAASGWNGTRDFLLRTAVSWFSILLLNGAAEAFGNLTGAGRLTLFGALFALLCAGVCTAAARRSLMHQKRLYAVTLVHGGHTVRSLGLYDSGNLLRAVDGEPVHIVSSALLARLSLADEGGQMIPFRSLGAAGGEIRAVKVEQMQITGGKKACILSNVWLGNAGEEMLLGKSYQVILNSSVKRCLS